MRGDNGHEQGREPQPQGSGPLTLVVPDSTEEDTDSDSDDQHAHDHSQHRSDLYYAMPPEARAPFVSGAHPEQSRELAAYRGGGTDSDSDLQPIFFWVRQLGVMFIIRWHMIVKGHACTRMVKKMTHILG